MDQKLIFDPAAARDFLDETGRIFQNAGVHRENGNSAVSNCLHRYVRLQDELLAREKQARKKLEELQSASPEETDDLERRIRKAQSELQQAQDAQRRLDRLWTDRFPEVKKRQGRMEERYQSFCQRKVAGERELQRYDDGLREIRKMLDGGQSGFGGGAASAVPIGWCPKANWFSAVAAASDGTKTVSLNIGGKKQSFFCDKAGTAKAYRMALRRDDQRMLRITAAMFEVESFRESLGLGRGDPNVPQLGGYHGNVSKQDPKGYESHHIPAKATQNRNLDWLPALSISREDHILTSSYGHKQFSTYYSVFSVNPRIIKGRGTDKAKREAYLKIKRLKAGSYKNEVIQHLRTGETGYLHIMKSEILNLRDIVGSKYDGAISAYLDAVQDMLATRGIPAAMPIKPKN